MTKHRPRARYELRNEEMDGLVEKLVALAEERYGGGPGAEYVRQMVVTAVRLLHDGTGTADLKLVNAALKELRHSFRIFAPYEQTRKVAVFGSARTKPEHPDWKQANAFAQRICEEGWMVITGAGDGIMGAAQGGAGRERSFGVNIRLPFEQSANRHIAGDRKLINFRYFFTRKVIFVKESHAIVLFPGGFGTHDEGYEALTLVQTGKSEIVPIVFVDEPGGSYWKDWDAYVRSHLLKRGLIGAHDTALYHVTDNVDDAVYRVLNFYSNYHSSRYVKDLFVIRVRTAPDTAALEKLNRDFKDLLAKGKIAVSGPLPEENGEGPELKRVTLHFNRTDMGRLRLFIDELNHLVKEKASPPREAAPHAIVEQRPSRGDDEDDDDGA